ncbi:MAG: type II secretion system minor pseudopilin GspJ [Lysobacteraceae bacterium]
MRRSASNPPTPAGRRAGGFTLIEMLVAVALFALAAVLALGGMDAITRARTQLDEETARLAALQFAVGLIERDLRAVAQRPVRDAQGSEQPALAGSLRMIELSRHASGGLLIQPRSDIERVAYQLDGSRLQRLRYPVLDRAPGSAPVMEALLDDVAALEWRYLGATPRPGVQWPPPRESGGLPRAVELTLRLQDGVEIRRLFELPATPPATP